MDWFVRTRDGAIDWGLTVENTRGVLWLWRKGIVDPFRVARVRREWDQKGERFGLAVVPAAEGYAVFDRLCQLEAHGFVRVKPGSWRRPGQAFDALVRLVWGRGRFHLQVGYALHGVAGRRSSSLQSDEALHWPDDPDPFHGPVCFEEELRSIWRKAWPALEAWLALREAP